MHSGNDKSDYYLSVTLFGLDSSIFFASCHVHVYLDEVAVIDEIQMMRDPQRGWAWTRALLGRFQVILSSLYISVCIN
jgi:hypothetical protein